MRSVLGVTFCGAYLVGSFALGAADEHSDVDFVVVTNSDVTPAQEAGLQDVHTRLYALGVPWAQHLEGSYIPKEPLRRVDASRAEFLFLDNGASRLVRDNHCNTAVTRWTLREHGVVLDGPEPALLVDEVRAEQLRAEMRARLPEYARWAAEGDMNEWKQPYLVLTVCRMLHTLTTGRVTSKRAAAEWAVARLDAEWAPLIRRALADRPDPVRRSSQAADSAAARATVAFAGYALEQA